MINKIFISKSKLEKSLLSLSPGEVCTQGNYKFQSHCSADDLDWNHMDWMHRPLIHNTYLNSVRIFAEPNFSLSLTNIKFLGFDVKILVSDIKIERGLFYQCYTIFGLIYIHGILENNDTDMNFSWYIISKWWLKPLHSVLSKKLYDLNELQINEDVPLRVRRADLKNQGYSFPPSERDYITTNDSKMRTVYLQLTGSHQISLSQYEVDKMYDIKVSDKGFVICKKSADSVYLWPAVCPHEGGPLTADNKCNKTEIKCPWHGIEFSGTPIGATPVSCYGGSFSFKNNSLWVNPV